MPVRTLRLPLARPSRDEVTFSTDFFMFVLYASIREGPWLMVLVPVQATTVVRVLKSRDFFSNGKLSSTYMVASQEDETVFRESFGNLESFLSIEIRIVGYSTQEEDEVSNQLGPTWTMIVGVRRGVSIAKQGLCAWMLVWFDPGIRRRISVDVKGNYGRKNETLFKWS
ncbi:hypothetical protein L1887_24281 [Cichorium endivia]|nr:hypothetical protein L1887_24281 [Cichorium endivia]